MPTGIRRYTAITAMILAAAPATAQVLGDSDGDGITDSADALPCDPTASARAFAPSETDSGMLLFEDLWPTAGDLDFNDVVLSYHYAFHLDATGRVVQLRATFNALAAGGNLDNGFALHLPVPASAVAEVTRAIDGGAPEPLMTSVDDADLTVVIEPNLRNLFDGPPGPINSRGDDAVLTGQRVELTIRFAAPTALSVGGAPYDVFVVRTDDPGLEIHFPQYAGSSRARASLFNSGDDASTGTRHYIERRGVPFVLALPLHTPYPAEASLISSLFPRILAFAESGGTTDADFYTGPTVDAAYAYADVEGRAAPDPVLVAESVDTTCAMEPDWLGLTSGVSASGGHLTLSSYTSEARSANVFEDDGVVEARVPSTLTNLSFAVGFDRASADATYQDLEHKIYFTGGGANGYFMGPWGEERFGAVQGDDLLRVRVSAGVVDYAVVRNGVTVYARSGSAVPRQSFFGDVWMQGLSAPREVSASLATHGPRGNNPPTVALTAPAAGAVYTAQNTITISASASDGDVDGAVARVDFFTGTTLIGSDTSEPFSVTLSNPAVTSHTLSARAYDQHGSVRTSASRVISVVAEANWLALTGGVSASGGNLTMTAYTSEARSAGTFTNSGIAEARLPSSIAGLVLAIGFDAVNSNSTYQDLDHKIFFNGGGSNAYFMGPWGEQRFGAVQGGDVLRVTNESGVIRYYVLRNGSVIYSRTGSTVTGQTFFADAWVQGISGTFLMTVRSQ